MPKPDAEDEGTDRSTGLTRFESRLLNLLALQLVQERAQTEQIDLLARAGLRPAEIAALLGTTRNTVSVNLSQRRRGKQGRRKKNAPKSAAKKRSRKA